MMRPTRFAVGGAFAALALLVASGCGDTETDTGSGDPSGSASSSAKPEVTDRVVLKLTEDMEGTTLSASNKSDAEVVVLLPIGEPDRDETSDGITLTYLRSDSESMGDEPVLFDAVGVSANATKQIDRPSFVDVPVDVRYCLEVVPTEDTAAPDGPGAYRVDAGEGEAKPVMACSKMTRLDGPD